MPNWWEQDQYAAPVRRNPFELPQQPNGLSAIQSPQGLSALSPPPQQPSGLPSVEYLRQFAAPVADAPKLPAPPPEQQPGLLSDIGNLLKSGYADTARGLNWLAGKVPGLNQMIDAEGGQQYWGDTAKQAHQNLSQAQQDAGKKTFLNDDGSLGDAWSDPRAYLGTVVESVPGTVMGMGMGGPLTSGLQRVGLAALPRLGAVGAGRLAMGAGAVGYGAGEGLIAGGSDAVNARDAVLQRSHDDLQKNSPQYRALLDSMTPDQARAKLAEDVANQAGLEAGLTVAATGAPMGAAFGKLFHGAGKLGNTRLGSLAMGTAGEAGQEFVQSGAEQYLQNKAIQQNVDPSQDRWQGVLNQAVAGALAGGLMGGAMGMGGHGSQTANTQRADEAGKAADQVLAGADQARDNLLNADDRTLTDSLAQLGALAQQGQLPESHQARVSSVMQDIQSELVRRMQRGAPTETGQPGLPGSFDPALGLEGLAPPLSSMGVQAEEQRLNDLGQWQRDGLQREIQRLNETATRRAETQRLERAAQEGRQRMQPVPPTRATPGLSSPILEGEWLPSEASPGSSAIRDQSPLSPLFDALPKPQTTLAQQRAALGQEVDAINQAPAGTSRQGLPSPPARLPERQDKSVQLQRGQSIELSPLLGQPSPKPTVTDAQRANLAGLMGQRPGRHQQSALPAAISPDRPTAQNKPIASQPAAADKTPPVLESPALPAFAKQHADGYLSRLNNVVRDLDSARLTDQKFHGQGRYAADTWTDLKPKVQAVYNEIQDILDSIEDPQNREAYRQYIAERLPKRFVSDQEAAFRGERTADLQTPAWAATPQSQAPLSQEAAHQSQPETSNGQEERQAASVLNPKPPASTGTATAPQAKQFSVRPTGYPNGGWHVVDQAGVIERFGAPEGKLARWFATDQEALAAADRLNVQANKAASQKTRARVSMPDSNKTSPNLRPERVGGNLPEADPSISLTVAQNETPNSASVAQGKPLRAAPRWNQATHEERTVLLKAAGIAESAIPQRAQQWGKWADIPEGSAKKRLREAIKADTGQHRKTQPSVATSAPIHETQQGNQPEQATAAVVEKALTHGKVKQSQVASAATAVLTMIDTHIQAAPATRKGTETVTIDVPGDGKFKIANSKTALQAFRQKVASSSAFKAQGIAKTPAPASLDQKALSRPKALTEAMLAEFETDKGGAADRHIEKANAWELIKQFGAKYILGDDGFIYTHIEPIAAFPRFAVGRLFDAKASKHSGLKRWHLLDQATGAIAYSADSKAAVLSAIKQNGVAVSPARTVSFSYLQDKVDAARNDLAQKLSVAPTGEAIQAELTRRMDAFADEQYGNDAEQAASESQSSQTKQQPSSLDEAKKDRADPQQTTPDTKDAISPPLNAKDRLLAALDEDIAASSGFDQRDLKAFRGAVERTAPKATDAEFTAAVMDGMTLGEKDAYLRAKEWRKQRNETRATQQQFPDRRYLNVPFAQKDTAKAAGAKWDADRKQWYWPAKNGALPGSLAEYLDRRFSRQQATTPITPVAARAQLAKALGDTQVKALERSGRLVIHEADPTKTGAAGFVDRNGVIHLVASNLENGDALSVALHEAMHVAADERFAEGDKAKMRLAHAALRLVGLKNFIGNPSFTGLAQEAYRLAATGNKTAQQALAKAQAEYEANPNTDIPQELVAYLAQYADEKLPLARRILSAIRAALFRMGIKIKLSPADIRAFALSALKAQARAATKKAQQSKRPQAAYSQPDHLSDDAEQARLWEDFQAVRAQFQTKQANTTAFQRWFGDGVEGITAKDGQPLTLYHGTPTEFYRFDISRSGLNSRHPTAGLGFFMTADKGAAYRYGGNVLELHTKITKPYYLTDADLMGVDSVGAASQLRRKLQEKGYDGAVVSGPGMAPYVIAFESKQVKLTSNQNPTESADFRYSRPDYPEGSQQWANEAYANQEIPDGWYVHGRANGDALRNDAVIQLTARWDVAKQYGGSNTGSIWLIKPKEDSAILDFSTQGTPDIEQVAHKAWEDFQDGSLPFGEDVTASLGESPTEDAFKESLKNLLAPANIVDTAGFFDAEPAWINWLWENFESGFIVTPDGAVALDPEFVDAIKVDKNTAIRYSRPGRPTEFMEYDSEEAEDYLEKAEDDGVLFHASPSMTITKILDIDKSGKDDFGGIFAARPTSGPWSGHYGRYVYEVRTPDSEQGIAYDDDIYNLIHNKTANKIIKKELPWLNRKEMDRAKELIHESMSRNIGDESDYDLINSDPDNAAWKAQRIRGILAKNAGFVGLAEEDGFLIFPGADIRLSPVQTKKAIADLQGDAETNRYSRPGRPAAWADNLPPEVKAMADKIGAEPKPFRERLAEMKSTLATRLRQGMVDRFARLLELDQQRFGQDVLDTETALSSWAAAKMSKSAEGALEAAFLHGELAWEDGAINVKDTNQGLVKALEPVAQAGELNRFWQWIVANRAERLASEGREHLFTPEEIKAGKALNQGQMADGKARAAMYQQTFNRYRAIQKSVMDIAEQAGLIDGQTRSQWEQDFYLPFYRVIDDAGDVRGPTAGGKLVRQKAFEKLKGGTEPLGDPLQNILKNWHHLIDASLKNRAATLALDTAETLGVAQSVADALTDKTSVWVMKNGQKVHYNVADPLTLEAISAISQPIMSGTAIKALAAAKRALTLGVTISPAFKITNLLRDSIQALAVSNLNANLLTLAPLTNPIKGYRAAKEGTKTQAALLAGGGAFRFGTLLEGDRDAAAKRIAGFKPDTILDSKEKIQSVFGLMKKGLEKWNQVGDRLETANRAALYDQLRKENKTHLQAALAARDLMDFSQSGGWAATRFLINMVPFLNARIQGLDVLYRKGFKPLGKALTNQASAGERQQAMRFGLTTFMVSLASALLYLAFKDDDDFKKREQWDRDMYWWFKIPGIDQPFRIPKPFEVGAIGTIAERLVEQLVDPDAGGDLFAKRMGAMLTQTFAFDPTPQLVKPILDVYANKDAFTKRDIETPDMERLSPEMRRRYNTSALASGLSEAGLGKAGLSPVQIEHLVRGYLGWIGAQALNLGDMVARPALDLPERPAKLRDMPVLGDLIQRFAPDGRNSRYVTEFYEQLKTIRQAHADALLLQKLGDKEGLQNLFADRQRELLLSKPAEKASRLLSDLGKTERRVANHLQISGKEKQAIIDQIGRQKDQIARQMGAAMGR